MQAHARACAQAHARACARVRALGACADTPRPTLHASTLSMYGTLSVRLTRSFASIFFSIECSLIGLLVGISARYSICACLFWSEPEKAVFVSSFNATDLGAYLRGRSLANTLADASLTCAIACSNHCERRSCMLADAAEGEVRVRAGG